MVSQLLHFIIMLLIKFMNMGFKWLFCETILYSLLTFVLWQVKRSQSHHKMTFLPVKRPSFPSPHCPGSPFSHQVNQCQSFF